MTSNKGLLGLLCTKNSSEVEQFQFRALCENIYHMQQTSNASSQELMLLQTECFVCSFSTFLICQPQQISSSQQGLIFNSLSDGH